MCDPEPHECTSCRLDQEVNLGGRLCSCSYDPDRVLQPKTDPPTTTLEPMPRMSIHIKIRWKKMGGHIHASIWQGLGEGFTWERNGDLVFDEVGWDTFRLTDVLGLWIVEGEDEPPCVDANCGTSAG